MGTYLLADCLKQSLEDKIATGLNLYTDLVTMKNYKAADRIMKKTSALNTVYENMYRVDFGSKYLLNNIYN
jgi:hypothetical protein